MKNCPPALQEPADAFFGRTLADACSGWLLHGDLEGWSQRTLYDRRDWLVRLREFLDMKELAFDANGLRAFFLALSRGAPEARCRRALKPASVLHVHTLLKAFGHWCVEEELLTVNPMKRIPAPILKDDGIMPFTDEELKKILAAARATRNALRDEVLTLFLADTGIRASECCALLIGDLDLTARTAQVRSGKGGKPRMVAYGKETAQALWRYLKKAKEREADDYLFQTEHGTPLDRDSLRKVFVRLGRESGVRKVHPHRFRHDCACRLLRNGAHVFGVQALLGHSRVGVTEKYVRLAEADVRAVHRLASPMDRLKGRER